MKKGSVELAVGLFVFFGLVCVGYLTVKLGKMALPGTGYYTLNARFQSVAGLREGANVEIAGVKIGQVEGITLDPQRQVAMVSLKILDGVVLTEDVIASVKTSGPIGDKYIGLSPGGSDMVLEQGDTILETESSVDFEELVSKYMFGGE